MRMFLRLDNYILERILTGHLSSITSICLSPHDNNLICTSSTDQTIRIWNISNGKLVKLISTTGGLAGFKPLCVEWSPFSAFDVMCCGKKGIIRIYNYQTSRSLKINLKSEKVGYICKYHHTRKDRGIVVLENSNRDSYGICVFDPQKAGSQFKRKHQIIRKFKNISACIIDLKFDPLSANYFVCLYEGGGICLFDLDAPDDYCKVKEFQKTKVTCVSWIKNEPGNFLTGDTRSGVFRKWNVSKETPLEIIKIRKSGFRRIKFSSYNESLLAVSFSDGSVGTYNIAQKKFNFLTEPGHIETIFGCAYCKTNSTLFATSSYDSRVKLWDTRTMKCVGDLFGIPSDSLDSTIIIYSISWHPTKMQVAGSLGNGQVWIWDAEKRYPLHKHEIHSGSVYTVKWNQLDESLLVSASKDKTTVVFREDGKKIKTYKHPNVVFGVDWSPHNKNILVTGCHDSLIRVFDITSSIDTPVTVLNGHSSKVYNVLFHPIVENTLMSGSNDFTVRIWNTKTKDCKILKGHSNNVRALSWNYEVPYFCLSGSWDGTIRIWDTRQGKCVKVITDHHADVYGLSSHPDRPFIYGSTSRDTTIRFWSMKDIVSKVYYKIVINSSFEDVLGSRKNVFSMPQEKSVDNELNMLCGSVSHQISNVVLSTTSLVEKYRLIFNFLFFPYGSSDVLALLKSYLENCDYDSVSFIHSSFIIEKFRMKSVEMNTKVEENTFKMIGSEKKEDVLARLCNIYLQINDMRNYCETLIKLGKWEKALSVSPAVSHEFWKELSKRYALKLQEKENVDCVPHFICSGDIDTLNNVLISREDFRSGFNLNVGFNIKKKEIIVKEEEVEKKKDNSVWVKKLTKLTAEDYMKKALPFHSSCCYLQINQVYQAVRSLEKGNELLHGLIVSKLLKKETELDFLYVKLAWECSKNSLWEEAIQMLDKVSSSDLKIQFVCHIPEDVKDIEKIYRLAGLQSIQFYKDEAEKETSSLVDKIKYYALSKQKEKAVEIAITLLTEEFKNDTWDWDKISKIMFNANCINAEKLDETTKFTLLGFSNFIGAQLALWKGYYPILPFLISNTRLMFKTIDKWLIPKDYLDYFLCLAISYSKPKEAINYIKQVLEKKNFSETIGIALNILLKKLEKDSKKKKYTKNIIIPTASVFPVRQFDGGRIKSFITGDDNGPLVKLNKHKYCSLAEAIMWKEVHPFSPLNDGKFFRVNNLLIK